MQYVFSIKSCSMCSEPIFKSLVPLALQSSILVVFFKFWTLKNYFSQTI